jgi:hypothetical protein
MNERIFPRWLVGLVLMGMVVTLAFAVMVISSSVGSSGMNGYSHSLLEQDRVMTEQMAVQSSMGPEGMLQRSQDPAYVSALEEHVRQFDRMVGGRTP